MKDLYLKKLFDLRKQVAILTGSAGRLGSRFAEVLSSVGSNVILVDIEKKQNKSLVNKIRKKYDTKPLAVNCDITDESQIKEMIKKVISKYGQIDILVNNAHYVERTDHRRYSSFENYPLDLWEKTTAENLRGLFLCSREVGKIMNQQKRGVIVNISSIYGLIGADQRIYGKSKLNSPVSYAVTKGGLVNLTRYLAAYWEGKNIRVNTLTLGGVFDKRLHKDKTFVKRYSEKTILGRMATKGDYDGALLFLVSNASSYMTGANLIVDGGWTAW